MAKRPSDLIGDRCWKWGRERITWRGRRCKDHANYSRGLGLGRYAYASGQRPCVGCVLEGRVRRGTLSKQGFDAEVYRIECHTVGADLATPAEWRQHAALAVDEYMALWQETRNDDILVVADEILAEIEAGPRLGA